MITVIGQLFGTSGYASHTRNLFNALAKQTDVCLMTHLPQGWQTQVTDAQLKAIKTETDYQTNLIITHPLHWRSNANAKKNMAYLVWEGDKIPKWMVDECLNPDIHKIIVPSKHTYDAVMNSMSNVDKIMCKNKFHIFPHGVDLDIFRPTKVKRDDRFVFLANKGFRNMEDRGGIQYLLRAYLDEFEPTDNVHLILKVNPAYGMPDMVQLFPELAGEIPPITVIPDTYTDQQINLLYNSCDVFVSPARAEAFNLPCAEAAACKKPVICTGYGGQSEFITNKFGGMHIRHKMSEVRHDIEYEGIKWATPSIDDLRKKMRYAYENKEKMQALGESAYMKIQSMTWDKTAESIMGIAQSI